MLIIPAAEYRKRRPRLKAGRAAPLTVLSVGEIDVLPETMYLTAWFNTTEQASLVDLAEADPGKWSARYAGKRYVGVNLAPVDWNGIRIGMSLVGDETGADELTYTNNPSDIGDAAGRMLAAFEMGI